MAEPYVGDIRLFTYNFTPVGFLPCDGSLVDISTYDTLFNLIGTTYGGDGVSKFGLPDLRGRVPVNAGEGYSLGQTGGAESVTLSTAQMPMHTHAAQGTTAGGRTSSPQGAVWATSAQSIYSAADPTTTMSPAALSAAGGSQPHDNLPPFLALNFCIASEGIYPTPS